MPPPILMDLGAPYGIGDRQEKTSSAAVCEVRNTAAITIISGRVMRPAARNYGNMATRGSLTSRAAVPAQQPAGIAVAPVVNASSRCLQHSGRGRD